MRIVAAKNLIEFVPQHPETAPSLAHWRAVTKAAKWQTCSDIQSVFPKAKTLNAERVRFEIAGGNYRLVVAFNFEHQIAFIKFIGSHAEYDRIDCLHRVVVLEDWQMDIRPIRSVEDHAEALRMIERLWNAPKGSPQGDTLDILATLVDAYEAEHHHFDRLDPIATIKAHMEMAGHTQADFAELIGSRSRASEILARKRLLNLRQVHKLVEAWKIPADLLIQPYELDRSVA
ncbi:type II toxin-antitoxin system HigB family toxin [Chelatococcus reniformis]|uniref:HTH cro/C1-type domain-containing protein n=1 Tax=Chelatococcus reniformis TaxID=1494448 RepID=A0A916X860_9HYPH|nr:type II toxin-antitoxin system HigB family toxin [Chelatococcus reniformis]GGC49934.1 hypothetical protein GCM10010994_06300 [Chelatococcus reniformis]